MVLRWKVKGFSGGAFKLWELWISRAVCLAVRWRAFRVWGSAI